MNIKKIWSGIREIVNIRNSKPHKLTQLKVGGRTINNPKDVSNKLNELFVNYLFAICYSMLTDH